MSTTTRQEGHADSRAPQCQESGLAALGLRKGELLTTAPLKNFTRGSGSVCGASLLGVPNSALSGQAVLQRRLRRRHGVDEPLDRPPAFVPEEFFAFQAFAAPRAA